MSSPAGISSLGPRVAVSVGMTVREMLDLIGAGALLALAIRWLLRLDVRWHWAVCIGAVSLLLQPWLSLHFGPRVLAEGGADILVGTLVAMALLGIAQVIGDH
jgi:uncharacterized membrane protein